MTLLILTEPIPQIFSWDPCLEEMQATLLEVPTLQQPSPYDTTLKSWDSHLRIYGQACVTLGSPSYSQIVVLCID